MFLHDGSNLIPFIIQEIIKTNLITFVAGNKSQSMNIILSS